MNRRKKNKVHFYITRNKDGKLFLWIGKPRRVPVVKRWVGYNEVTWITSSDNIRAYNLNPKDFDNLKWEDEPKEVFLNMEKNEKDKE